MATKIELFTVTYGLPGKAPVTERGFTHEGVVNLMNSLLRRGGWGVAVPQK